MDEKPVFYDLQSNRTADSVGSKSVIILVCMADGTKLTPMVIFKQKTMPKEKFLTGVIF